MFRNVGCKVVKDPTCVKIAALKKDDFFYFDKDGFELSVAEHKFYRAMGFPIDIPILNHSCWQEPWLEIDEDVPLLLDHCMILHRADFNGYALEQLKALRESVPQASFLINCRKKWGFDFALDGIDVDGNCFEVVHIEYDSVNYDSFCNQLGITEKQIYNIDWMDASKSIQHHKDSWQHLKGFEQNHWKAEFLLNWSRAEYLEKTT